MPRRPTEESVAVKVRIKESLRQKLEKAAEARGASVNQEIAERLSNSFNPFLKFTHRDDPAADAVLELLSQVMYAAGNSANAATFSMGGRATWCDNAFAFGQVRKAVDVALQAIKPPEAAPDFDFMQFAHLLPPEIAEKLKDGYFENIGEIAAWAVLHETKTVDTSESKILNPERAERARRLKAALRHIVDRIPD